MRLPVHRSNITAVKLFRALRTQWNQVGISGLDRALLIQTGLKYEVVEVTARLADLELTPDTFTRLQVMEDEALAAFAEARR